VRARRQVETKKPRLEAPRRRREELAARFFDAVVNGDEEALVELPAADVIVYDGGGKATAFPRPTHGRDKVMRVLRGPAAQAGAFGVVEIRHVEMKGQPGAVLFDGNGRAVVAIALDVADEPVQTIRAISNPEKLHQLGTFAPAS
jgi:RNA polymerase sigma-70 factor, ECF subfamily